MGPERRGQLGGRGVVGQQKGGEDARLDGVEVPGRDGLRRDEVVPPPLP